MQIFFDIVDFDLPFDDELRRRSGLPLGAYKSTLCTAVLDDDFEREILAYPHIIEIHLQEASDWLEQCRELDASLKHHKIMSRNAKIFYKNNLDEVVRYRIFYFFKSAVDASAASVLI